MRLFAIRRSPDGAVAEGIVFSDGVCSIRWPSASASATYDSTEAMLAQVGSVEWVDPRDLLQSRWHARDLAGRMRDARRKKGMTLRDVAQSAGVSAATVMRMERGDTTHRVDVLERITSWLEEQEKHEGNDFQG